MSLTEVVEAPLRHLDRFFIGGEWAQPSSDSKIEVTDSATEQPFFTVGGHVAGRRSGKRGV